MGPLLASLLDLLHALGGDFPAPIIAGGFGLYLKRQHLKVTGARTLFVPLPEPRATNDVDLFIRAEILADVEQTSRIATAIRGLGYAAVEDARFMQWTRSVSIGGAQREVKLDLLVGPLGVHRARIQTSSPRARPKGKSVGLHAYCTDEALAIEAEPWAIPLSGQRTTGEPCAAMVRVPRAFPYLMMKLFAFNDRKADPRKDVGRHHALDLYTIVGMMTEAEYAQARDQGRQLAADSHVTIARQVVATDFSATTGLGILRLREHPLFRAGFQVPEFIDVLRDIFFIKSSVLAGTICSVDGSSYPLESISIEAPWGADSISWMMLTIKSFQNRPASGRL